MNPFHSICLNLFDIVLRIHVRDELVTGGSTWSGHCDLQNKYRYAHPFYSKFNDVEIRNFRHLTGIAGFNVLNFGGRKGVSWVS